MPRTEIVIRAFVASPGDVTDERTQLEEIVRDVNLSLSANLGARLELVRWETHTIPGVDSDAQAVINADIADEYDIFIGLLWTRFGTPTGRAGSGTEEEFMRAYLRHEAEPSRVDIMFYFKDAPVAPSQIDPVQLAKIVEFRTRLGEMGVLYRTYSDRDAFGSLLRVHLARQLQEWARRSALLVGPAQYQNLPASHGVGDTPTSADDDDDAGLVELMEEGEEGIGRMTDTLTRMGRELSDLTAKLDERTAEFGALSVRPGQFDRTQFKRISKQAAEDMVYFARRSEADLPLYEDAMKGTFEALSRAAVLFGDFGPEHKDDLKESLTMIRNMRKQALQAEKSISSFRGTVTALPRLSTDINRAKRRMITVVDGMVDALSTTQALASDVEKILWDTLGDMPDPVGDE